MTNELAKSPCEAVDSSSSSSSSSREDALPWHVRRRYVTCVELHIRPGESEFIAFVGSDVSDKEWKALHAHGSDVGGGATKLLEDRFDEGFLSLRAKHPKKMRYVRASIHGDDTVACLRHVLTVDARLVDDPRELCFWVRKSVLDDDHEDEVRTELVATMLAHGQKDVRRMYGLLTGQTQGREGRSASASPSRLSREQLMQAIRQLPKIRATSVVLGARLWRAGMPCVMGSDPFRTSVSIDHNLVTANGAPRRGYYDVSQEDLKVIEDVVPPGATINAARWKDVLAFLGKAAGSQVVVNGHVAKFFPLLLLQAGTEGAFRIAATGQRENERVIGEVAAEIENALKNDDLFLRCALGDVRMSVAPPSYAGLQSDMLADILYELFAAFRATRIVPCLKLFDGTRTTYKINQEAVRSGAVPSAVLQRWTHVPIGRRTKPFLQIYVQMPSSAEGQHSNPSFAKVVLRQDLSVYVQCSFVKHVNARADVVGATAGFLNHHVLRPIRWMLEQADLSYARVREVDGIRWLRPSELASRGSSVTLGRMTCNLDVGGRIRMPSIRELEQMMQRMRPFFFVVGRSNGNITLQYKRTSDFASRDRIALVVALSKRRPKAEVLDDIANDFGMSHAEAAERYEAVVESAAWRFRPAILSNDIVPVIMLAPNGKMGYRVTIVNARNVVQIARIANLLTFAIRACSHSHRLTSKAPPLAWVPLGSQRWGRMELPASSAHNGDDAKGDVDGDNERRVGEVGEEDDDMVALSTFIDDLVDEEFGDEGIDMLVDHENLVPRLPNDMIKSAWSPQGEKDEVEKNQDALVDGRIVPEKYFIGELYKADGALFRFKVRGAKGYTTDCGHNNGRQPIVLTPEEKDRIDRDFPGSYADFVHYGSTPELAARNIYMCPNIWCPKSRVSMSDAQFKASDGKCPLIDEEPILFKNNKYFDGRDRHIGFLSPGSHPNHLCAPCCFNRPRKRFDACGVSSSVSSSASSSSSASPSPSPSPSPASPSSTSTSSRPKSGPGNLARSSPGTAVAPLPDGDAIRDPRYILGDVLPLEPGRFGILPTSLSWLLDNYRCGSREGGSGQITWTTDCFVRCGVPLHRQAFLMCIAKTMGNPVVDSPEGLTSLIRANLSPDVFVSLNDGRLCRAFMHEVDPEEMTTDPVQMEKIRAWLASHDHYVRTFRLQPVLRAMATALPKGHGRIKNAVRRECLIYGAMTRFFRALEDDSIVKSHRLLLDLFNRDLPWLNPDRINIVVFERDRDVAAENGMGAGAPATSNVSGNGDSVYNNNSSSSSSSSRRGRKTGNIDGLSGKKMPIYLACAPLPPRLASPFVFVIRQGEFYEPMCRVTGRARTTLDMTRFHFESDRRIHNVVAGYVRKCGVTPPIDKASSSAKRPSGSSSPSSPSPSSPSSPSSSSSSSSFSGSESDMFQNAGGGDVVGRLLRAVRTENEREGKRTKHGAGAGAEAEADHRRPVAQVIDYAFRMVGLLLDNNLFLPTPVPTSVLVDSRYRHLEFVYVSDLPNVARPQWPAATCIDYVDRLSAAADLPYLRIDPNRTVYSSPSASSRSQGGKIQKAVALTTSGGQVIPLDLTADELSAVYLEHLNTFAGQQVSDERLRVSRERDAHRDAMWQVRSRVVRAIRSNPEATRELNNLRSSFHPFPLDERRKRVLDLVNRYDDSKHPNPRLQRQLADALLYEPHPLLLQQSLTMDRNGMVMLTDVDIMSGALDRLLQQRGATSRDQDYVAAYAPVPDPSTLKRHKRNRLTPADTKNDLAMWDGVVTFNEPSPPSASSSKSKYKYRSNMRRQGLLLDVDVYALLYLVQRMTYPVMHFTPEMMADAVKNQVIRDARAGVTPPLLDGHRSIPFRKGKPLRMPPAALLARIGAPPPTYSGGLYDVAVLATLLGLNVWVYRDHGLPPLRMLHDPMDTSRNILVLRVRNDGGLDAILDDKRRVLFTLDEINKLSRSRRFQGFSRYESQVRKAFERVKIND